MKIEAVPRLNGDKLLLVKFKEQSNFWQKDSSWAPTWSEIKQLVDKMVRVEGYNLRRRGIKLIRLEFKQPFNIIVHGP